MLTHNFFNQDPLLVARQLLGKVLRVRYKRHWLSAQIIETEAYYLDDKASHSSLGYTEKRKALFMPAGTIYMYYACGADSLNVSCGGPGNAVLIKAGYPYLEKNSAKMLAIMQQLNPAKNTQQIRPIEKLCAGQTLLCRALNLKVRDWDQQGFDRERFFIEDVGYMPEQILQTTRLGIPKGRDEHLPYRLVDAAYAGCCTKKVAAVCRVD